MIGGNIYGTLQTKSVSKDEIGSSVLSWVDLKTILGYLDMTTGDARYTSYDSKVSESTDVFVCDYVELPSYDVSKLRMIVDGVPYDVTYIDNPMKLNRQLEIFLKKVG